MYRRIHNQFGTAGMILSVVAIVLALAGGAIAASSGKPGPRGPRGKTGKTGPQGPAGIAGTNGTNGKDGANGTPGTNGVSVTSTALAENDPHCEKGGSEFVSANATTYACNGKKGNNGTNGKSVEIGTATSGGGGECANGGSTVQVTGEPATKKAVCNGANGTNGTTGFTETLPPGKTETGTWAIAQFNLPNHAFGPSTSASFPIPLEEASVEGPSGEEHAFYFNEAETEAINAGAPSHGCAGDEGVPQAPPGVLCVYTEGESNENAELSFMVAHGEPGEYGTAGAYMTTGTTAANAVLRVRGTWAVTAPPAAP
jgi:hypothetical protein